MCSPIDNAVQKTDIAMHSIYTTISSSMRNTLRVLLSSVLLLSLNTALAEPLKPGNRSLTLEALQGEYQQALKNISMVYGPEINDQDLAILRAGKFFYLRPWFKSRNKKALGQFTFNPDAIARLEGLKRFDKECQFKATDGNTYTTWETVERGDRYLRAILAEYKSTGRMTWSGNYLLQPQVRKWFQSDQAQGWYVARYGLEYSTKVMQQVNKFYSEVGGERPYSTAFDLDILFSLHSVLLDGSHAAFENTDCGGYGEFRVCEHPPAPDTAQRESLARKDLPLVKDISAFLAAWRTGETPPSDPFTFAARVRKELNTIHPFRDGNGRTAKMLSDAILHLYGLPDASIQHAYLELSQSLDEYSVEIKLGVKRSLDIMNSCSTFLSCAMQAGMVKRGDWNALCSAAVRTSNCRQHLLKLNFQTPPAQYQLAPCDCSPRWQSQKIELPQCD